MSTLSYAQTFTSEVTHLGNVYAIKVEENKDHDFDVFITNETNASLSKKIVIIKERITEALFEKKITEQFDSISANYIFKNTMIDSLNIKTDLIGTYQNFIPDDIYLELLISMKPNKEVLINQFIKKLDTKGVIVDSLIVITMNSINNKPAYKIIFNGKETLEKQYTNEKELFKQIDSLIINKPIILSSFYSEKDLKAALITDLSNPNSAKLAVLYKDAVTNDSYRFIGNYQAEKSSTLYEASIKQYMKDNYFVLRFCSNNETKCQYTIKLDLNVSLRKFEQAVDRIVVKGEELITSDRTLLYAKCIEKNEKAVIAKAQAPMQKEIDALVLQIENSETEYSGVLKLNESVSIYEFENKWYGGDKKDTLIVKLFKPKYATVRFFNNRAKNIVVVGDIIDENDKIISEEVSINFSYSIPLRAFTDTNNRTTIYEKTEVLGCIYYKDIFNYYPYEEKFNFAVKNKEYHVTAGDTVKVEQRHLADYFTPVIFSDFLGLNSSSENGLIIAEGNARIPLWIRNWTYWTWIPAIRTNVNVSLYNGFDDSSRAITIENNRAYDATKDTLNIFDYVKFSNINAGLSLDLVNFEMKGLSTDVSFGAGLRYYRAAFKYTNTNATEKDDISTDQLNALAPEINLNFQIRPQTNFGADLNFAYSWLHARGTKNNMEVNVEPSTNKDKRMLRVNLDLYSKVNPDKTNDGIYGRIGGYYHIATKDFYPQIMVGYATNLSSFINKFKKEDENKKNTK